MVCQDIVLTGALGAGKTTVLEEAAAILKKGGKRVAGILKIALVREGRRDGFSVVDVESGNSQVLATRRPQGQGDTLSYPAGKDGKTVTLSSHYRFEQAGFEFADAVFQRLLSDPSPDIVIVDELGLFEARGEGYQNAVKLLGRKERPPMLVIVRQDVLERILPLFPRPPEVIVVDERNRGGLAEALARRFIGKRGS